MKTQTLLKPSLANTDVYCVEESLLNGETPAIGKTFKNNREVMKMYSRLSEMNFSELMSMETELSSRNPLLRLYTFVLLFRDCYNASSKVADIGFSGKIDTFAKLLGISPEDKAQIAEFYQNEEPYSDKNSSIYFNNDRKVTNVKYLGLNVEFSASLEDKVVYLKYLSTYNVFLSMTFSKGGNPYFILQNYHATEINILNELNYFMDDFGYLSFEELVFSVKRHQPFGFFELSATSNTPKIVLDPEEGKIVISGSSSPFSPTQFFEPILEWLDNYCMSDKEELKIFFMLDYFNTYTSKFLVRLAQSCERMEKDGKSVRMFWYYDPEDEDLREFGEHLNGICKNGFEFCAITDDKEDLI